ncbi:MAG: L-lactate dehydrogenase [Chloroflexi bacterium]|nr:L-lactate dehydrogenase [Chloroflexota bacterium]
MKANESRGTRVVIVGAGNVGATCAYALLLSGLAAEIVLIDSNQAKAEGEVMDLNHAVPLTHPTRIWAGDYADCAGASVIVIAAGTAQRPGETRLDLLGRNAAIFKQIVSRIVECTRDAILLVATNPVDVLSHLTWKLSGFPPSRVIGSGTILDTARFRYLLSRYFGVDARSIHAYIIGEHGDSEVPVWSLANIAGMRFADYCAANGLGCEQAELDEIYRQTRDAAYRIIETKGATYYAVAAGLVRIVEAIVRNQRTVLSVSSLVQDYYDIDDVYLSLPTIVSGSGVDRLLRLKLSDGEVSGLRQSAEVLKTTAASLQSIGG